LQVHPPRIELVADGMASQLLWNEEVTVQVEASERRSDEDRVVLTLVAPPRDMTLVPFSVSMPVPFPRRRSVSMTFAGASAVCYPGTYKFKYFCAGSLHESAESAAFQVMGPRIEVCLAGVLCLLGLLVSVCVRALAVFIQCGLRAHVGTGCSERLSAS
jgi:hypothetical protein